MSNQAQEDLAERAARRILTLWEKLREDYPENYEAYVKMSIKGAAKKHVMHAIRDAMEGKPNE